YVDANGNGAFDPGEAPLVGVDLTLTGTDYSGRPVSRSARSDSAGLYTFAGLMPGDYMIAEAQPSGYGQGGVAAGSSGGNSVAQDVIGRVALGSGTDATGYSFAETTATLSGHVYSDSNDNGVRDAG